MNTPENPGKSAGSTRMNGSTPAKAAPLGTTLKTTVERGHAYMVPRLYNVEITLEEIIRGQAARERAEKLAAPAWNLPDGYEYLLALVKFGYFERGRIAGQGSPDAAGPRFVAFGGGSVDVTYTLAEGQIAAASAGGDTEYELPRVIQQPQPALTGWVFHPGEIRQGWILFQVPQDESQPLLIFKREHVEGVAGIWGYIWFQLYS
jgi:hypothetical protein